MSIEGDDCHISESGLSIYFFAIEKIVGFSV